MVEASPKVVAGGCCGCVLIAGIIVYCIFLPATLPYVATLLLALCLTIGTGVGWGLAAAYAQDRGYLTLDGAAFAASTGAVLAAGVVGGLLFPFSLPLLLGLVVYQRAPDDWRRMALGAGTAVLGWVVFGGALVYPMLWLCIASADSPCNGTVDVPEDFVLNESVFGTAKAEMTVNDLADRRLGGRRFVTKRLRRCSAPGAPFRYTHTMEYRDATNRVTVWADRRAIYVRDVSAPWETWDIHDCNNNLLFTIEERLVSKMSTWWNEWTIRDAAGVPVAISDRYQLWVTVQVNVQDAQTRQIIGVMAQRMGLQLKLRFETHVLNATRLPPYMYGFIGMLTKQALDAKKKK